MFSLLLKDLIFDFIFVLESLLANYAVTPRKLWNSTAEQKSEKNLLQSSGEHLEHLKRHNCKGPIYGFNEAEIESWPGVRQLNYQVSK